MIVKEFAPRELWLLFPASIVVFVGAAMLAATPRRAAPVD
jgi:hypothetical protein